MRYLLDTCVVSQLTRTHGDPRVRDWLKTCREHELHLSALTIGEVRKGVNLLEASRRRSRYELFLSGLEHDYAERILPIDLETAQIWGELTAAAQTDSRRVPAVDGLIAATAIRHGLCVVTLNVRDFEPTGARIIDPTATSGPA